MNYFIQFLIVFDLICFGVYQITDLDVCEKSVYEAIKAGYRLLDTAAAYGNESALGKAVKRAIADGLVKREDLFITTKVWVQDMHKAGDTYASVKRSLALSGLDYFDLVLLHQAIGDYFTAYRDLEKAAKDGLTKAIGVSNYFPSILVNLCENVEIIPAVKSRDVGLDRSMIMSHGHDDRVCSYANLAAILDAAPGEKTQVALFADKEEIGSVGNTGVQSSYFPDFIAELLSLQGHDQEIWLRRTLRNSEVLSADVCAAFDPVFADAYEEQNSAKLGYGICLCKYTGARGKAGSNDANAEFMAKIRRIFNEKEVPWQVGELGKVDQGGGGTIAYIMADWGCDVVDCGVAMHSMHAPLEIVAKADAYSGYLAYKAFFESK